MDNTPSIEPPQTAIAEGHDSVIDIRAEAHDPSSFPPPPRSSRPPSISVNPHHQIRIRHPHYPDSSNVLLTFFAPDSRAGGIEYGVLHAACGVISGNRWNGWFTTTTDEAILTLTYGDILYKRDYYFHLPESSLETPYAIVPTFREWTFPHENLHPCWRTNEDHIPSAQSRFAAPSSLSAAIFSRDQSCRMSGFVEGTQAVHLCPRSEEAWFQRNEMSRYNLNPLLVATGPIEDTANALLLRQDLHTHFDAHKFVFVPKKRKGEEKFSIVTHMLIASRELGFLNHNVCLKAIPDVDISFLFARFAWTIFTLLGGFLRVGVARTLIGTTISTTPGLPQIFTAVNCRNFLSAPKSRSQSPTKRPRKRSDAEVDDNEHGKGPHRKRQKVEDLAAEEVSEASKSSKAFEEVITPVATDASDVLRNDWLKKERLRSDPDKAWLKEEEWAYHIRSGNQVMGPEDTLRFYKFMGHEQRECELEQEDAVS
jgi:hypothetical protein